MNTTSCETIIRSLGELFTCSRIDRYTRIRTPFLYPDGDVIDLFVDEMGETVTDLGETLRWLRMQSLSSKRSKRQQKLLEDVCLNHGLELYKGMLTARVKPGADFASVIMRVAQGALRVADLWFTMRTRAVESVSEEVELFLAESDISYERGEKWVGRSGKTWQVDFHTRTRRKSSLVCVLGTGSRAAAKGVAEHVLATWYDLNNLKIGPEGLQFVSLFDDTLDVWTPEDFKLVEDLSTIARWSKPDEFAEILNAA